MHFEIFLTGAENFWRTKLFFYLSHTRPEKLLLKVLFLLRLVAVSVLFVELQMLPFKPALLNLVISAAMLL